MKYIEEIVAVYDYIKKLEQENRELKMQLDNVRKSYKKLNQEVIKLELEKQERR